MRKHPRFYLGLFAAVLFLIALFGWWASKDVYYRGKFLKSWTLQFSTASDPRSREEARAALQGMGARAVPGLIRLLKARDPLQRRFGCWLAVKLPPGLCPAFLKRIGLPGAEVTRAAAADALGLLAEQARGALPALKEAFSDPEGRVRWAAGDALARIGGPAVTPWLIELLRGPDPALRQLAAATLGRIGPEARGAIPALAGALDDRRAYSMAVMGLCRMGASAAPDMLERCSHGSAPERAGAARVLGGILRTALGAELASPALEAQPAFPPSVSTNQLIAALVALLHDPVVEVRVEAAASLALAGPAASRAIPALIDCLNNDSPDSRRISADALGAMGRAATSAVPELTRLAEDPDSAVRAAAKQALAKVTR